VNFPLGDEYREDRGASAGSDPIRQPYGIPSCTKTRHVSANSCRTALTHTLTFSNIDASNGASLSREWFWVTALRFSFLGLSAGSRSAREIALANSSAVELGEGRRRRIHAFAQKRGKSLLERSHKGLLGNLQLLSNYTAIFFIPAMVPAAMHSFYPPCPFSSCTVS
jgi:hypothetical protein